VPAAAVIPAPRAYIKVVAVKKLVVGPWGGARIEPCEVAVATAAASQGRAFASTSVSLNGEKGRERRFSAFGRARLFVGFRSRVDRRRDPFRRITEFYFE